ncbi:zinc ribbon domain-containing protein [Kribbella sp. NPDC004138]
MSRFRLYPNPAQQAPLLGQCMHARYMWNLGLEQWRMWTRDKGPVPSFAGQCRQLTEARATFPWLRAGSQTVQQQALRDLQQAVRNFFAGTHRRPSWRKAGLHEGFRIVGAQASRIVKLNRKWAEVNVPKVGWVRFRLSRQIPAAKSYRITRDRAGGVCGHRAPENRKSQAIFRCVACGHQANADVNAAVNIAAGRAVSARREMPPRISPTREPQLATSAEQLKSLSTPDGEDVNIHLLSTLGGTTLPPLCDRLPTVGHEEG